MRTILFMLILTSFVCAQQPQQKTFEIEEANLQFEIQGDWELAHKTGKLEQGKVQYSFTHPLVAGYSREINPTITVTVDKGSWFENEAEYVKEKWDFHRLMDDQITKQFLPDDSANPIQPIKAHFAKGTSGLENNPYGQKMMLITFWNQQVGFHMEIQTSEKDRQLYPNRYIPVFNKQE